METMKLRMVLVGFLLAGALMAGLAGRGRVDAVLCGILLGGVSAALAAEAQEDA